jgi:hypothetical protein
VQKYYKDYVSDEKITKAGKVVKEMKYTGDYYEYHLSAKEYKQMRKVMLSCILTNVILFVLIGLLNNSGSFCFYVLLPYLCILLGVIYLCFGYFHIPKSLQKMEFAIYDKSYLKVKFSIVGLVAASTTTVIGDAVFILRNVNEIDLWKEILFWSLSLLITIISTLTLIYHNRIVCKKIHI